jgi:hypothetical protein
MWVHSRKPRYTALEQKPMNIVKHLERAALDAHRRGESWAAFWRQHEAAVRRAEPWSQEQYRRLVNRLLHLLVSGDESGMEPVGDDLEPWVRDDEASKPADVGTRARCLLPLLAIPGVTTGDKLSSPPSGVLASSVPRGTALGIDGSVDTLSL